MAFKRRRATRRPMKRRRGFKRRRTGWGGYLRTGMSLARQVWKLKGLVNSEMYKLDQVWSPGALTNGLVSSRVGITVGDGDSDRTGNSVFARAYNFSGSLTHNASGSNNQVVRISIVIDQQQISDTAPSYTDIYESVSPYAHLNSATVGRFKVIFSQIYVVNNYDKNLAMVRINLPMRHHVRYNGTTSADIQKGGIYFCVGCDEPTANTPVLAGEHRLSYHDN